MTDQPQAQITPEAAMQEAPMPSAEQTSGEAQVSEVTAPQEVPTSEPSLPEGVKDRTAEQFDKLKTQLAEERTRRMEYEQYVRSLSSQQSPMPQEQAPNIYDPETGEINVQSLQDMQRSADLANKKAVKLEQELQRLRDDQQARDAYNVHPELDPSAKDFDEELHNLTRAILLDSMVNPQNHGGKELSMKQAADKAKGYAGRREKELEKQVSKEVAAQTVESLTAKEQASLEATGRSDRRQDVADIESLRRQTRQGGEKGLEAITARLRNIPSL